MLKDILLYPAYLFQLTLIRFSALCVPDLKKFDNYKNTFGLGKGYWDWRLYMETMKATDSSTYHLLIWLPNLLWALPLIVWVMER